MRASSTSPADQDQHPLDARARTLWMGVTAVSALVVGIGAGIALGVVGGPWGWALPVVPLLVGLSTAYARLYWSCWWWAIGRDGLELGHGVVVRRTSYVPYHRIQQIDVERGPFDRVLGLASLQVHTAAATTDASIPGLALEDARTLRQHLLERASIDDGV